MKLIVGDNSKDKTEETAWNIYMMWVEYSSMGNKRKRENQKLISAAVAAVKAK